jgi:hydrogenase maturation protease
LARRLTVVGVGNSLMGDDGVGVAVARELLAGAGLAIDPPEAGPIAAGCGYHVPGALGPGVDVVVGETAGLALLRHFLESDVVIVVDALDASGQGADPGQVFRFSPDDVGVVSLRSNNIHGMGVPHLVAHARLAGADPDVIVFAVQVGDVRPNPDTLTPAVAAAVPGVVELIGEEIAARRG